MKERRGFGNCFYVVLYAEAGLNIYWVTLGARVVYKAGGVEGSNLRRIPCSKSVGVPVTELEARIQGRNVVDRKE